MSGIDFRPRVLLHTQAGVVVILVDPANLLQGTVTLPVVGVVPYDVVPDYPTSNIVLHMPLYGDYSIPVDLTNPSGGGGTVTLPTLGNVPYEMVLGDPGIPPEQLFSAGNYLSMAVGSYGMLIAAVVGGLILWKWGKS